jgi:hypothetical protein
MAVSLGAGGGFFVANADPGPAESTIVAVVPERVLDTRDPVNLGLTRPFVSAVSQKLQVTGNIATASGTKTVVPAGATGVLLNVTPVGPSADGFVAIRPGDATGSPASSSLNLTRGAVIPNSVQVAVPTAGANAGQIDITFDAYGTAGPTTDMLIDIVGYTTNTGLQQLVAKVNAKANTADVYTKAQVDAKFASTVDLQISIVGATASTTPVTFAGGCITSTATMRLGVDVPVGATITSITGFIFGAGDSLRLNRITNVQSVRATATSTSSGLALVTANLATPKLVEPGDFFFLDFTAGGSLCGAAIRYTIPSGTSVQLAEPGAPEVGVPTGQ